MMMKVLNASDFLYEALGKHSVTFGGDDSITAEDDVGKNERLDYCLGFGMHSCGCKIHEFKMDNGGHVSGKSIDIFWCDRIIRLAFADFV